MNCASPGPFPFLRSLLKDLRMSIIVTMPHADAVKLSHGLARCASPGIVRLMHYICHRFGPIWYEEVRKNGSESFGCIR